jgi:hypothetical protein
VHDCLTLALFSFKCVVDVVRHVVRRPVRPSVFSLAFFYFFGPFLILPQILGRLPTNFPPEFSPPPPTPAPICHNLPTHPPKGVRRSNAGSAPAPPCRAACAQARAAGARRRRKLVAHRRRRSPGRSRAVLVPPDPGPALRSSVVEAAALRSAGEPLGSWRDRSAPSAGAEPRRRGRWSASTRR